MPETLYYLTDSSLAKLIQELSKKATVYLPTGEDLNYNLQPLQEQSAADWKFTAVRAVEPLKALFFRARQDIGSYFAADLEQQDKPRVVIGAKACDLASLRILDHVFLEGDFQDPDYKASRENLLIIAGDCTDAKEVCFCTLLATKPYPQTGYDLNLSPLDGGYIVEVGSENGQNLIDLHRNLFGSPQDYQITQRDRNRTEMTEKVDQQLKSQGLTFAQKLDSLMEEKAGPDRDLWSRYAKPCVECGACNFICPTCHCFLLADLQDDATAKRFRNWDSCQYKNFARVAGGANQRPARRQRLHTRFDKKFKFFPHRIGQFACTGCGRCVEACLGKIDLREILKELAK